MAETQAKGKEFLGQPWWIWAAGGAAIVAGIIYLRLKGGKAAPAAGTGQQAAGPTKVGLTFSDLNSWMTDHQRPVPPKRKRKPKPQVHIFPIHKVT